MTSTEIEAKPQILQDIEKIETVGMLALKGYRVKEIADSLEIPQAKVKEYIRQYDEFVQYTAENDPLFLEHIGYNTKKMLIELGEISKEAWESVEMATEVGSVNARIGALKLLSDVVGKKGQFLQVGQPKSSGDNDTEKRLRRAEEVNQMLSDVIKSVVGECDKCRGVARLRLEEAFLMMPEVVDAEVVDG